MVARCQVRTLKIRTDDRARLPRITHLIEDALRTASFPGLPPNGVVYIKSMDLGRFDDRTGSLLLANRIDAFIRTVRPTRMGWESSGHPDLPAVWFADELAPHRLLTEQLARGHLPRAWFWPVAVKGWSARRPVAQSVLAIITQVAQEAVAYTPPAVLAHLAYVLEPLFANDRLLHLLQSLTEKPFRRLVTSLGLKPNKAPQPMMLDAGATPVPFGPAIKATSATGLKTGRRELVARAVDRWGVDDARAILTTGLVMTDGFETIGPAAIRRVMIQSATPTRWRPDRPPDRRIVFPPQDPDSALPTAAIQAASLPGTSGFLPAAKDPSVADLKTESRRHRAPASLVPPPHRPGANAKTPFMAGGDSDPSGPPRSRRKTPPPLQAGPEAAYPVPPPGSPQPRTGPERVGMVPPFVGAYSPNAGFSLLINVLDRLALESIFEDHPLYPLDDLRETILWRIAFQQKIPLDDPVVQCLRDPDQVRQRAEKRHRPITRQAIFDKAPADRQVLFRIPRSRDPLIPCSLKAVRDIFVIAACRFICHRAGLSIRELVRRPAFIALTRTHMDITASPDTLDIRVRLAGLDVNPGWVPWLGRVVQIHYTEADR